jgi:hypothetical protein
MSGNVYDEKVSTIQKFGLFHVSSSFHLSSKDERLFHLSSKDERLFHLSSKYARMKDEIRPRGSQGCTPASRFYNGKTEGYRIAVCNLVA